jgi:peroxiredoxin
MRSLSDYLGSKVVVVFYRGHWCGACRQHLDALRTAVLTMEDAGAAVLAISAEPLERARASAEADGLPFTILSDEELVAIDRYGVRHEGEPEAGGKAIARPSLFVLDRGGIVRFAHVGEDPLDRPTIRLILLALETLD